MNVCVCVCCIVLTVVRPVNVLHLCDRMVLSSLRYGGMENGSMSG